MSDDMTEEQRLEWWRVMTEPEDYRYRHLDRCYYVHGFRLSRELVEMEPWIWDAILHAVDPDDFVRRLNLLSWVETGSLCQVSADARDIETICCSAWADDMTREERAAMEPPEWPGSKNQYEIPVAHNEGGMP